MVLRRGASGGFSGNRSRPEPVPPVETGKMTGGLGAPGRGCQLREGAKEGSGIAGIYQHGSLPGICPSSPRSGPGPGPPPGAGMHRAPARFYRLPPTAYRLPPTAYRLPPAACRLPPAACRLPPAACRLPPAACRLPPAVPPGQKKSPAPSFLKMPGKYLATTYSHRTYRPNTIGAAAFHFRVRNGTGWFHRALATRGRSCSIRTGTLEV
jgi:hypothetical protein